MKLSFKDITLEQFKKLISTMDNEDFCSFINHLLEVNMTDNILVPLFKSKNGVYLWLSYFSEDCKPYNEKCAKIINTINELQNDFEFVLINENAECIFFTEDEFKDMIFNFFIFDKLYDNKEMWADKYYSSGALSDGYDYIINHCDISVLFN